MKWLGSLLGGMGPKVGLPLARYALQPDASLTTDIAPAPEKMRMLKLRLAQGETRLRIFNAASAGDIDMHDQERRDPAPARAAGDPGRSRTLFFAVTRGGGRLTIQCIAGPCELEDLGD